MEQDPKQKDTNTQKDTAKGHTGLLPLNHSFTISLQARIKSHFTDYNSVLNSVHMEMAKNNAQLIRDMTSNNPGL